MLSSKKSVVLARNLSAARIVSDGEIIVVDEIDRVSDVPPGIKIIRNYHSFC